MPSYERQSQTQRLECEAVFAALTRGPFPSGDSSDTAVTAHLQGCAACRQFAEALRPINEYEREALSNNERYDLPVYLGPELGDAPVWPAVPRLFTAGAFEYGVVERLPRFGAARRRVSRKLRWGSNLLRFIVAVICGAMLAVALMSLGLGRVSKPSAPSVTPVPVESPTSVVFPLQPTD